MRARLVLSVLLLTATFGQLEAQWLKETYVSVFAAERDTNYIQDLNRMFSVNASVFQKKLGLQHRRLEKPVIAAIQLLRLVGIGERGIRL